MTVRLARLDALKGAAIVAVVAIHTLSTGVVGLDRPAVAAAGGLLTASVPVFMATAAYFAAREYDRAGARALTRRIPRLVVPYVVATLAYVALAVGVGGRERAALEARPAWSVAFFGGAWYHLYFLPALAQILLLVPALVRVARSRALRPVLAVAGLVLATGAFGSGAAAAWLDLRWAIVWVAPALVGVACGVGTLHVRRPACWLAVGAVILAAEAVVAADRAAPPAAAYARLGILVVTAGALCLLATAGRAPAPLAALGRHSLGVYLVHPALLLAYGVARDRVPFPLWAVPVVTAAATAGAWLVTIALARTPAAPVVGGRHARRTGSHAPSVEPSVVALEIAP